MKLMPTENRGEAYLKLPGGKQLSLASPVVMGILNVTPDSFSDGGKFTTLNAALYQAEQMIRDGAAIIDIGGESSRPGAQPISIDEEQARVIPVVQAIASRFDTPISIDTYHAATAEAAIQAGVSILNDITALRGDEKMLGLLLRTDIPVILMHMQGTPQTMQQSPTYIDVVREVFDFFSERIVMLAKAGVARERIVLDPGIGFGKRLDHNLALLRSLGEFAGLELPLMIGVSRKSFIQKIDATASDPLDRIGGGLAATITALDRGAKIVRTHDVRETIQAIRVWERISRA